MYMYRLTSENELKKYGKTWSLSAKALALANQQKACWPLAGNNYRALKNSRESEISFGTFVVKYQFNPERIRSSAANTSPEAISSRPCFLCPGNLPAEQAGIPVAGRFILLVNPYPIFPVHLTIPSTLHTPQRIDGSIDALLEISRLLNEFVVFYNGPKCGASAPDHLHFQAGIRGILPLEDDLDTLVTAHSQINSVDSDVRIYAPGNYLRRILILRSASAESLQKRLSTIINLLPAEQGEEPMVNILTWYNAPEWTVAVFPRAKQRPWQYFADDFDKLVISPAAVELGGLVVLPREEDYFKLSGKELASVYEQVTLGKEDFETLKMKIAGSSSQS